jgi:hypothetical protein
VSSGNNVELYGRLTPTSSCFGSEKLKTRNRWAAREEKAVNNSQIKFEHKGDIMVNEIKATGDQSIVK